MTHAAAPKPTKPSARRTLDWRFLVALTVLLAVSWMLVRGFNADRDRRDLIHALAGQTQVLAASRQAASDQRAELLATQDRLLRQVERVQQQQDALLRYLKRAGIRLPQDLSPANRERSSRRPPATPDSVPNEQTPRDSRGAAETRKPSPGAPSPAPGEPPAAPAAPAVPSPSPDPLRDLLGGLTKGLHP